MTDFIMIEPAQVAAIAVATLVLVGIPGPNMVYITTRSLAQGSRAGVVSALGVETGTAVYVAATAIGLSAVIAANPLALSFIKYAGIAYLLYLAVRELGSPALKREDRAPGTLHRAGLGRVYLDGVLINLLNPKSALFFLAFLPPFLGQGGEATPGQVLALGAVTMLVATAVDLTYALGAGAIARRVAARTRREPVGRPSRARWRHLAVAGVYVAIAGFAALSSL